MFFILYVTTLHIFNEFLYTEYRKEHTNLSLIIVHLLSQNLMGMHYQLCKQYSLDPLYRLENNCFLKQKLNVLIQKKYTAMTIIIDVSGKLMGSTQ